MSQYDFGTIDPNTKSGTALATDLNSWRTALHSQHSGSSAPAYIATGMQWVDSTSGDLIANIYDGTDSIPLFQLDATNNWVRWILDADSDSYIEAESDDVIVFFTAGAEAFRVDAAGKATFGEADINGGAINGVSIGGTTPGSGKFTNIPYEHISSVDISSDATVDFTGFDASVYDDYEIELQNVVPATDAVGFQLRTSTDGGTGYDSGASDYSYAIHGLESDTTRTDVGSAGDTRIIISSSRQVGSDAGEDGVSGIIRIHGPGAAEKTTVTWAVGYFGSNGNFTTAVGSGARLSSADVDAVRLLFSSGNLESGRVILRGKRIGS